eukprot:g12215.t1
MILSSDVEPWLPGDWPKALATSPYMSTQSYIIFRAIIMLLFIGHFIAHLLEYFEEEGLMYWIYFSRWVTTLEVIEQVLSFSVVLWASQRLSSNAPNPPEVPVLVKVYIALLSMVLPSVLLSAGLYYALTPYWPPPYVSLFIHGGDVILLKHGRWGDVLMPLGRWRHIILDCKSIRCDLSKGAMPKAPMMGMMGKGGQMMPGKGGGMPAMPMGQMMMCLRHDGGSGGMNLGEVMKA